MLRLTLIIPILFCIIVFWKSDLIVWGLIESSKMNLNSQREITNLFGIKPDPPFDDQVEVDKLKHSQYKLLIKVVSVIVANVCVVVLFS